MVPCKEINCSSWIAKKANGPLPEPPKFKELDVPALHGRLKRKEKMPTGHFLCKEKVFPISLYQCVLF